MGLIPLGILSSAGGGFGTYELIQTTILGSTTASVTFSGLSEYAGLYKHLQIRAVPKISTADNALHIQVNADTGNNYRWHMLYTSTGTSVLSFDSGSTSSVRATYTPDTTANIFAATIVDILDPFSTTKNKTIRSLGGYGTPRLGLYSGVWLNTNAVTEIKLIAIAGSSLLTGSRFSLYGIR
jgi:hypothetical protein